jgi:PKD repeat protein
MNDLEGRKVVMERNLMCWILILIILIGSCAGCSRRHHNGGNTEMTPAESADGDVLSASIVSPSSNITIAAGQAIAFQGIFSGGNGVVTCHWSFGEGIPDSAQQDPGTVSFPTPGSYTVSFTAEDDSGASIVDSVIITVVPDGTPVASIVVPASNKIITAGQAVSFQGSVSGGDGEIAYRWSFGGAAPDSTQLSPGDVSFSTPGSYSVTFIATDSDGDTSSDSLVISVTQSNTVPVAAITSPTTDISIVAGQSLTFQGSTSGGDGVITYGWSFGGAAPDSTLQNPGAVAFPTPGRYTVIFTAQDRDGDKGNDSVLVTVARNNTVPVATITSPTTDTSILAGQSVIFQGSVSAGDGVLAYTWSFGGAAPVSTQQNPGTIAFSTLGNYTVVFTVTDSDGDMSSDTVTITVARNNTVPVATIISPTTDTSIVAGQSLTFQGSINNGDGVITYGWSFGGAAPDSTLQNPGAIAFPTPGRYTVIFTARDSDGDMSSDSVAITVEEDTSPTATIISPSADISVVAGQALLFQGSVSGGNGMLSYRWSFAGGAVDQRVKDPGNVYFMSAGVYTVTFTVTDSDGDTGNDTVTVTVTPITSGWISLDAGYGHTAALKSDGSLWAWGNNNSGQLGDGTLIEKIAPVRIGNSADWKTLTAGYYHTLSLKQDGTLWAWGENANGQLGDASRIDRTIPEQIGTDANWTTVDAGAFHTLAVKTDGSLWAWG